MTAAHAHTVPDSNMRYKITYTDKKTGALCETTSTGMSKVFDLQNELKQSGMRDVEMHLVEETEA